jgi:hypothetical protein
LKFIIIFLVVLSLFPILSIGLPSAYCFVLDSGTKCIDANFTGQTGGNGSVDGNNYTSSISFGGNRLTLARVGMSSLTADISNNFILLDAGFNLTNYPGLSNKLTLACQNITGASSNLCTLTDTDTNETTRVNILIARVDSLNNSKLNTTDQRYNDTTYINVNYYNISDVDTLLLGTQSLYYRNITSTLSNHLIMSESLPTGSEHTKSLSSMVDGQGIVNFTSNISKTNIVRAGNLLFRIQAEKSSGTKDGSVYAVAYKRFEDNSETTLCTSANSPLLTSVRVNVALNCLVNDDTTINTSERLITRWFANVTGGGSAPTIAVTFDGGTGARTGLNIQFSDFSETDPVAVPLINSLYSSTECSGTDQVYNVTLTSSGVQILCSAQGSGSGMSSWIWSNGSTTHTVTNGLRINVTAGAGIYTQQTGGEIKVFSSVVDTNDTGLYYTKNEFNTQNSSYFNTFWKYSDAVVQNTSTWNSINLKLNIADAISTYVNRSQWTTIDSYPSGCSAGSYVSAIGDTLTCVSDQNNFTSSLSFGGALLTLGRTGLTSLTATIPNNAITLDASNITSGTFLSSRLAANTITIAGENVTSGTIAFVRLPSLANTHNHDGINITNKAAFNNAITLDGVNITSGTINVARLPGLNDQHTHAALNVTGNFNGISQTGNITKVGGDYRIGNSTQAWLVKNSSGTYILG